jgi:hypothetical protein
MAIGFRKRGAATDADAPATTTVERPGRTAQEKTPSQSLQGKSQRQQRQQGQ